MHHVLTHSPLRYDVHAQVGVIVAFCYAVVDRRYGELNDVALLSVRAQWSSVPNSSLYRISPQNNRMRSL
jgi:hypothetical protein